MSVVAQLTCQLASQKKVFALCRPHSQIAVARTALYSYVLSALPRELVVRVCPAGRLRTSCFARCCAGSHYSGWRTAQDICCPDDRHRPHCSRRLFFWEALGSPCSTRAALLDVKSTVRRGRTRWPCRGSRQRRHLSLFAGCWWDHGRTSRRWRHKFPPTTVSRICASVRLADRRQTRRTVYSGFRLSCTGEPVDAWRIPSAGK